MKILAIGNSFSANSTKFFKEIVRSAGGCKLVFGHACIGGCPLEKHYRLAMKHERSPGNPDGKPYWHNGRRMSLKAMLKMEKWDYVTIQQYSMYSFQIGTYRPWGKRLYNYIKKYAPQAEIVFHQTWAYREDDRELFNRKFTPEKMYRDLAHAYRTIAKELGIKRIIPVGDAFHLATNSPKWKFIPDTKFFSDNPGFPALPKDKHSIHGGYHWRDKDGVKVLGYDSHHANIAGEFMGGCIWLEFFYGKDCRKIKFRPKEVPAGDAEFLKSIAHQAASAK